MKPNIHKRTLNTYHDDIHYVLFLHAITAHKFVKNMFFLCE